ncbi:hypothetical protein KR038_000330 [Drosophila bunnanda]|nr:hypothetical protein KR038_000330 [Drosophila bunnanda]
MARSQYEKYNCLQRLGQRRSTNFQKYSKEYKMKRSVLFLLISVLVLSVAYALPVSLEESIEDNSQLDESKDNEDSSSDFSEKTEEHSMEINARRRRSAGQEKYRNLELLATICPEKDFKDLEKNPLISVRIEIEDMYAVCAQLKDRQPQRWR